MTTPALFPMPVRPPNHPNIRPASIGVLLLNLGTPDGTSYWPMRRYLRQFLSDRRVIEVNPILWQLILNLFILTTRPSRSGRLYASVWNKERDEGPLKTITRAQTEALARACQQHAPGARIIVDWAMRYGNPTTQSRLEALTKAGCQRILVFPLYPQYSAATTATACDDAFRTLMRMRWQPAVRVVPPWHDEPGYIDALAHSITRQIENLGWQPEVILASFHGVPRSYLDKGDPYHCACARTARLLAERLQLPEGKLVLSFQSRFGREEWLQPYTDETVKKLASAGVRDIAVIAPGFTADCLETLEELNVQLREIFIEHGGSRFAYLTCLNDEPEHVTFLYNLMMRELGGWI